jgi:hypothetical protein
MIIFPLSAGGTVAMIIINTEWVSLPSDPLLVVL